MIKYIALDITNPIKRRKEMNRMENNQTPASSFVLLIKIRSKHRQQQRNQERIPYILTLSWRKTQWPIKNSYVDCTFRRCFNLWSLKKPRIVHVNTIWIFNAFLVWQIVCCLNLCIASSLHHTEYSKNENATHVVCLSWYKLWSSIIIVWIIFRHV